MKNDETKALKWVESILIGLIGTLRPFKKSYEIHMIMVELTIIVKAVRRELKHPSDPKVGLDAPEGAGGYR